MGQSFSHTRKKKQVFDTHETQVSKRGEADLHRHLVGCKKNPGHSQFIPVKDFTMNHLPEGYRDDALFHFIKATADLTVRVDVKMTSAARPEFWPNTETPYPFYNMRGKNVMRVGTGMVSNVIDRSKDSARDSYEPSSPWRRVIMTTARHVVFDNLEARHTSCRLFYDSQDSPLVTLDNWMVLNASTEGDWCVLYCDEYGRDLVEKMTGHMSGWFYLYKSLFNRYHKQSLDEESLIIIVSHPHGCPKQVSVGHWINVYRTEPDRTKYTYTTCTCPGSSGACIQPIGFKEWYYDHHVHSGVNSEGKNFSGTGRKLDNYYYKFY